MATTASQIIPSSRRRTARPTASQEQTRPETSSTKPVMEAAETDVAVRRMLREDEAAERREIIERRRMDRR
ncbi:MAG TPA: hypothetical protein DCR20_07780, partial [Planctomycetaceae bacterium]|nr:hypothetical protein [Planctomycetaceae bacterium]